MTLQWATPNIIPEGKCFLFQLHLKLRLGVVALYGREIVDV